MEHRAQVVAEALPQAAARRERGLRGREVRDADLARDRLQPAARKEPPAIAGASTREASATQSGVGAAPPAGNSSR
jgi:hypothetical protein